MTDLDTTVHKGTEGKEWSEIMRFSPDGKWLAIGNHDNFIYIIDANTW